MYKLILISCLSLILNRAIANSTIEFKRDTILVFVPVIICISNLLVIQTIIPLGYERILPKLYAGSSLLYVVLTYFLIPKYTYVGMAVSVLIVELVVISVAFWYLKFRKVF